MSLRKSPEISDGFLAASRSNGSKSNGPKTEEGKRRSSQNSYKHGLYAAPDRETRELMWEVGEDPELLERLESELRVALQPANAMEALIIADIARLYRDKELLENSVRETRQQQAEWAGSLVPCEEKDLHSRFVPGNRLWGLVLKQQGRLDWRIEAKLNLLMRLKKQWPAETGEPEPSVVSSEPDAGGKSVREPTPPQNASLGSPDTVVEPQTLELPENAG